MQYQQLLLTEPAANFRALARQGIQGRWGDAFLKGFLYLLILTLPALFIDDPNRMSDTINKAVEELMDGAISSNEYMQMLLSSMYGGRYYLTQIYSLVIGGALAFGIISLYMRYRRRQEAPTELLFSGFSHFGRAVALNLLMFIFTSLWTLLFIIPGVIAFYRYRLAFYILADNPGIGPLEAINISKAMMTGNKWKLFCLDISFIGWGLLAIFAIGVISVPISGLTMADPSFMYGASSLLLVSIVGSVISCLPIGLLYVYHGTAVAAFYERASGLLKYRDEVEAGGYSGR
jgi:uncharacterized membrane protein